MTSKSAQHAEIGRWVEIEPGILCCNLRKSDGETVDSGDLIRVHYELAVGAEREGTPIWVDSSWVRTSPFRFKVGAGQVLKGVDLAVPGMRVAEERRIIIGPEWAYGDRGLGDLIPMRSTLTLQIYVAIKETEEAGST